MDKRKFQDGNIFFCEMNIRVTLRSESSKDLLEELRIHDIADNISYYGTKCWEHTKGI